MLAVAIIGAGKAAAGLGAVKTAISKGPSFKILQAASLTGGRSLTDTQSPCLACDLGCRSLYGKLSSRGLTRCVNPACAGGRDPE